MEKNKNYLADIDKVSLKWYTYISIMICKFLRKEAF